MSSEARSLIEDPANDVHYSAASVWEIAIKSTLRRKDFRVDLRLLRSTFPVMGLTELPVTAAHAVEVTQLPAVHPAMLTNDAVLGRYGATVRVV